MAYALVPNGSNKFYHPGSWFRRGSDGTGGGPCTIDSGSSHSRLTTRAFHKVLDHLREHFGSLHRLVEVDCEDHGVDSALCYCLPTNWRSILPGMTWHFEQHSNFYVESMKLFTVDFGRGIFYLVLKDGGLLTVVGVEQQINYRFVYDLRRERLEFVWEDCSIAP